MKLLRKIKSFFKKYLLDIQFRNKINLLPEIALIIYGFVVKKYSIIFYGCLVIALINLILNAISKKIITKELQNKIQTHLVSTQTTKQEKSDEDIINL